MLDRSWFASPTPAIIDALIAHEKALIASYPTIRPEPLSGQILKSDDILVGAHYIWKRGERETSVEVIKLPYEDKRSGLSIDVRERGTDSYNNPKAYVTTISLASVAVVPYDEAGHWNPTNLLIAPLKAK